MLTRIRIEAEGSTTGLVQEDIFSMYDLLIGAIYAPELVPSMLLAEEVYEHTGSPNPDIGRWYKGRAIARFTNVGPSDPFVVDSDRLRGRRERIETAFANEVSVVYPHASGDDVVLGPEVFASPDESVICWRGENYYRAAESGSARP